MFREKFFCGFQHISFIPDNGISADCQLNLGCVAFQADDLAHIRILCTAVFKELHGYRLRFTEIRCVRKVVGHSHGKVHISCVGHSHVIQHLVTLEEPVPTGPGFCRRFRYTLLAKLVVRFRGLFRLLDGRMRIVLFVRDIRVLIGSAFRAIRLLSLDLVGFHCV